MCMVKIFTQKVTSSLLQMPVFTAHPTNAVLALISTNLGFQVHIKSVKILYSLPRTILSRFFPKSVMLITKSVELKKSFVCLATVHPLINLR